MAKKLTHHTQSKKKASASHKVFIRNLQALMKVAPSDLVFVSGPSGPDTIVVHVKDETCIEGIGTDIGSITTKATIVGGDPY